MKKSVDGRDAMVQSSNHLLGGSSQLGYVVINHGDRFRPLTGLMGPLPNGRFMAYK